MSTKCHVMRRGEYHPRKWFKPRSERSFMLKGPKTSGQGTCSEKQAGAPQVGYELDYKVFLLGLMESLLRTLRSTCLGSQEKTVLGGRIE